MPHANLVISAVGDESHHPTWLSDPQSRNFDLCLIYFGKEPNRYADEAEHYVARQGVKFQLMYDFVHSRPEAFSHYDAIWCPDDDIAADTASINRLFALMEQYRLQVAQPGIAIGDAAFRALRRHPEYLLRYTQYVEVMCPAFSQSAFQRVLPTFAENVSAWGIDWLWASMFGPREVAVIDAVSVHHTRALQAGGVHKLFAARGINPQAEYEAVVKKYRLNHRRHHRAMVHDTARLRAIDTTGRAVWTRPWWTSLWPGKRQVRAQRDVA